MRDPVREVIVATVFFGALGLLAWREGVFERLGATALALGLFALAMAALTVIVDREVRAALLGALALLRKAAGKSPAVKRAST